MLLTTEETALQLLDWMRQFTSVAVAYSGGVDSAVVAKAACMALKDQAVAVTAVSPSLAQTERQTAVTEAAAIGIRHLEIRTDEFEQDGYRQNSGNRCYHCKSTLYSQMQQSLQLKSYMCLVNGTNADDLGDYRPGIKAAKEADIRSPLAELNIDKKTVRLLAAKWQLNVADKPAAPCLSSRIAYGIEVTADLVQMVERAECAVRKIVGVCDLRVRVEVGLLARIEVPLNRLPLIVASSEKLTAELRAIGFLKITVDLNGFRSGNLNDSLPTVPLRIPESSD